MYSSRWEDLFGYAQVKTEMRLPRVPFLRPYLSVRLLGDVRGEDERLLRSGISLGTQHHLRRRLGDARLARRHRLV